MVINIKKSIINKIKFNKKEKDKDLGFLIRSPHPLLRNYSLFNLDNYLTKA